MIYFTLPGIFQNFVINLYFKEKSFSDQKIFKTPLNFSSFTGNVPYAYWNGGYNNCIGKSLTYNDLIKFQLQCSEPIRLNCSNVFLKKNDYEDSLMHTILEIFQNGANSIEISNIDFFEYLNNKYPNYNYIFSNNANLIHKIDENIINILAKEEKFKLIQIPYDKISDFNFLKQLNKKNQIEIPISVPCDLKCSNFDYCLLNENLTQYEYSSKNIIRDCLNHRDYNILNPLITIEDIKEKYIPLGFNHFYIAEVFNDNIDHYLDFLINYFIKDEYKIQVYKEIGERLK